MPQMPSVRLLARGSGWCAVEYLCTAGPHDPVFEERHDDFAIVAVVQGSFRYRSPAGTALLYPGALMLGNHGNCYECGHDHGRGDRCVVFHNSTCFLMVCTGPPDRRDGVFAQGF